jgi:hypothetical protein
MEAFPKGLPINSVILLGSGTHMLRVGSAGYAQTWLAACSKLDRLCHAVQLCPLMPILDGVSSGAVFRSLIEIHCWFSDLFDSDPRGLKDVWEKFTQTLKDLTTNSTLLSSPDVYTYLFPADIQSSSLRPITFTSASSSPDSVCTPSRKATMELLLCLTQVLNRDFCTYLGLELHLPRDQTTTNTGTEELHFTLVGGSILGKTKKHLETLGERSKT